MYISMHDYSRTLLLNSVVVLESSHFGGSVSPVPESGSAATFEPSSSDMVTTTPHNVTAPSHVQSAPVPGMESPALCRAFTAPVQGHKTSTVEMHPLPPTSDTSPKRVTAVVSTADVVSSDSLALHTHPPASNITSSLPCTASSSHARLFPGPSTDVYEDSRPPASGTLTDTSADELPNKETVDRHPIQRQEGHISSDRDPSSAESSISLLSPYSGQSSGSPLSPQSGSLHSSGSYSSYLDSLSSSPGDCKMLKLRPRLQSGKCKYFSVADSCLKHMLKEGYHRGEVTVHLGEEPAGIYWFDLPGQSTLNAIKQALDEACRTGTHSAYLEFKVWRSSTEGFCFKTESSDSELQQRLNPVSSTSNLRLIELCVLGGFHTGSKHATYYLSDEPFDLSKDTISDFLFAVSCYCSDAGSPHEVELYFVFS